VVLFFLKKKTARFWALVGHVDQLARRQNVNVQTATESVLVPVEISAPIEETKQPPLSAEFSSASTATPKTRRKNAVEKVRRKKRKLCFFF
jgi:hypothetical protein